MTTYNSVLVILLFHLISISIGEEAVFITVLNARPLRANNRPNFQCYATNSETTKSYGRYIDTRNGGELNLEPNEPSQHCCATNAEIVSLPTIDDNGFGAFYCRGTQTNKISRTVPTILLRNDAKIQPNEGFFTKTVDKGDMDVTLGMERTNGDSTDNRIVWKFNDTSNEISGESFTFTISGPVSEENAGIYEAYYDGERNDGRHGIMRLIVRECVEGRWGPPNCFGICDKCYNGGVCDDKTGKCICPPGFKGENCLNACGGNSFGKNCEFSCGISNPKPNSCRNPIFCLPDPYGCTCNTGYHTLDCGDDCPTNKFGAGCTQDCHCTLGSCNQHTGACEGNGNQCLEGWSGDSCQIPDVCEVEYYGSQCTEKCHCLNDVPCDKETGECPDIKCPSGFKLYDSRLYCEVLPAPHNPIVRHRTPTSITLSLNADQPHFLNDAIQEYAVEYQKVFTSLEEKQVITISNSSNSVEATILNLTENSSYLIRVRLKSGADVSLWSDPIAAKTLLLVPPAPSKATVRHTTSTSITFSLNAAEPHSMNGDVQEYNVEYQKVYPSLEDKQMMTISTSQFSVDTTLTNLTESSSYLIRVQLTSDIGVSPWSDVIAAETLNLVPPAPHKAAVRYRTSTSITLLLNAAEPHSTNGAVQEYNVEYQKVFPSLENKQMMTISTSNFSVETTIRNLTKNSNYLIRVHLTSDIGISPWSAPTAAKTLNRVPPAPHKATERCKTPTSITLSLNAVEPHSMKVGAVQEYAIEYQKVFPSLEDKQMMTISTSNFSVETTIGNLTKNSHYLIRVQLTSDIGVSPWSAPIAVTTPNLVPPAPNKASVRHKTPTSITLSLNAAEPHSMNGDVQEYAVEYQKVFPSLEDKQMMTISTSNSSLETTIGNLTKNSNYLIRIQLTSDIGVSPWSAPIAVTTPNLVPPAPHKAAVRHKTSTSMTLSLDAAEPYSMNGDIQEYAVEYQKVFPSLEDKQMMTISTSDFSVETTLRNLTENSNYLIWVQLTSDIGISPWSAPIAVTTPNLVPPAPNKATVKRKTSTSVTLSLNATEPHSMNGDVQEYAVEYQKVFPSLEDKQMVTISTSNFSVETTIRNLTEYSNYLIWVQLTSDIGVSSWSTPIAVTTAKLVPPAPNKATLRHKTSTSITISLNAAQPHSMNGDVQEYAVEYQKVFPSLEDKQMVTISTLNFSVETTIGNLTENSHYLIWVQLMSDIGVSPWGAPIAVTTPNLVPPAPHKATLRHKISTSMTLSLDAAEPHSTNGDIQEYAVEYQKVFPYLEDKQMVTISTSNFSVETTIRNLTENSNYLIWVQLTSDIGVSPWSAPIAVTTPNLVPPAPIKAAVRHKTSTSTTLSLNAAEPHSMNGDVQEYAVEYQKVFPSLEDKQMMTISTSNFSVGTTIENLTENSNYLIWVQLTSDIGVSPWSAPIAVTTPNLVPPTPNKAAVRHKTSTSITLSLNAAEPHSTNGDIQEYAVEYQKVYPSLEDKQMVTISTSNFSVETTIGNLTENSNYLIWVQLTSDIGVSPWSAPIAVTTPNLVPPAPNKAAVRHKTPTSIILSLNAGQPHSMNGDVQEYAVEYQKVSPSLEDKQMMTISTSNFSVETTIRNLTENSHYLMRVQLTSDIGVSPWSAPIAVTTPNLVPPAPNKATVRHKTSTSITLSLNAFEPHSMNGDVQEYAVEYQKVFPTLEDKQIMTISTSNFSVETTIGNLTENSNYLMRLKLTSDIGVSPWSAPIAVTTPNLVPPAPNKAKVRHKTSTSVTLSLNAAEPHSMNGDVQEYAVEYQKVFPSLEDKQILTISTSNPASNFLVETTIGNLTKNSNFLIRVQLTSDIGVSPWSAPIAVTTPNLVPPAPNKPVVRHKTSTSITLSLNAAEPHSMNGDVQEYAVKYQKVFPFLEDKQMVTISTSNFSVETTIGNLTENSNYLIWIRLTSDIGVSPWAGPTTATTPILVPPAPNKATIRNKTPTSITLSLNAAEPHGMNGDIQEYAVEYQKVFPSLEDKQIVTISASNFSVQTTLGNLTKNSHYLIWVQLTSDIGVSPWNPPVAASTLNLVPPAPNKATVRHKTPTSVTLSLNAAEPHSMNGDVQGYAVEYQKVFPALEDKQLVTITTSNFLVETTIRKLTENSNYLIRVHLTSDIGVSPWSEPITAKTPNLASHTSIEINTTMEEALATTTMDRTTYRGLTKVATAETSTTEKILTASMDSSRRCATLIASITSLGVLLLVSAILNLVFCIIVYRLTKHRKEKADTGHEDDEIKREGVELSYQLDKKLIDGEQSNSSQEVPKTTSQTVVEEVDGDLC